MTVLFKRIFTSDKYVLKMLSGGCRTASFPENHHPLLRFFLPYRKFHYLKPWERDETDQNFTPMYGRNPFCKRRNLVAIANQFLTLERCWNKNFSRRYLQSGWPVAFRCNCHVGRRNLRIRVTGRTFAYQPPRRVWSGTTSVHTGNRLPDQRLFG